MACAGRILIWWDREIDSGGRAIRSDVRLAGRDLWEQACQQTFATLADHGPAAELMENAVAQASRYLNRIGEPLSSRKHGLVMLAFRRALRRHAAKLARFQLVGDLEELSGRSSSLDWVSQADARLQLEGMVRRLTARNADVLMLRAAGYEWRDIGRMFGVSVASVRNSFWREIEKLRQSSNGA